ncbi:hypothetical protein EDB85DRAFT_1935630 [Lactarius pseudohatsudake]|nr:hypothetical protein EDB85DRAFT_1935630 [Lactarius pseudohatsudake]
MSSITPSMRIRVLAESQSGVPQVRSWFNIEQEISVASLKSSLCTSISALREARVQASELVLLLDDFELLDNTAVNILRDGDLVCLRRRTHSTKRKVEVADDVPRKRHRSSLNVNGTAQGHATKQGPSGNGPSPYARKETSDSSSSSSPGSSSNTSSDDSSSDSESDSDTDSDSTSTSSSSNAPLRPPPTSYNQVKKSLRPTPASVPPGFGKPQTHARNERRRKKRLFQRTAEAAPPVPGNGSNAIPLGAAKPHVHTPELMMMSLKNKNKRRGFKNTASVPSHVTFQDDDLRQPQRLIPPSERDQLPPRLFVTSVDVEAGMWPGDNEQKWDRKQKKAQRDAYGHAEEEADVKLDYGEMPKEEGTTTASDLDYAALEKAWATAPVLKNTTALLIGSIVGWQELGVNPTTLTPETMLFLARLVSSDEHGMVVVRLRRPGLGIVSFGGGDMDVEEEEETFSWENIAEMQWRHVPTSR